MKNDSIFIGDNLLIDKLLKPEPIYDYNNFSSNFTLIATNDKGTHTSHNKLSEGALINETILPDSIFRRQDWIPEKERRIRIFNNYDSRKMETNGEAYDLRGVIRSFYGFKDYHMIIELDNPYKDTISLIGCYGAINRQIAFENLTDVEFDYVQTMSSNRTKVVKGKSEIIIENAFIEYTQN